MIEETVKVSPLDNSQTTGEEEAAGIKEDDSILGPSILSNPLPLQSQQQSSDGGHGRSLNILYNAYLAQLG